MVKKVKAKKTPKKFELLTVKTGRSSSKVQHTTAVSKTRRNLPQRVNTPDLTKYGGASLIQMERQYQIGKGFDATHDDTRKYGDLLFAAYSIIANIDTHQPYSAQGWVSEVVEKVEKDNAGDIISQLIIAGAMIAAEIDRLRRAEQKGK